MTDESRIIDPCGPPEPEEKEPRWRRTLKHALTIGLFAGGTILFLMPICAQPTMGAARSWKLKWEQRNQQIQAAVAEGERAESEAALPDRLPE